MKKKHFIFLGTAGIIYYSWLFIILFISLILMYESNTTINWPAIIIGVVFGICFVYTYLFSYWTPNYLKFPYRKKLKIFHTPELIQRYWWFSIYKIKLQDYPTYYLLRIEKNKATSRVALSK